MSELNLNSLHLSYFDKPSSLLFDHLQGSESAHYTVEALDLSQGLIKLTNINEFTDSLDALIKLVNNNCRKRPIEKLKKVIETWIPIVENLSDQEKKFSVYCKLGYIYYRCYIYTKNPKEADSLTFLNKAEECSKNIPITEANAIQFKDIYNWKGDILNQIGRYEESEMYLQKALKIIKDRIPYNQSDIISIKSDLSELYYNTGRYKEAKDFLKEVTAYWTEKGRDLMITLCYLFYAELYLKRQELAKAKNYLEKVLDIIKKSSKTDIRKGRCHCLLGYVYSLEGNYQEAQINYLRGFEILQETLASANFFSEKFSEEYKEKFSVINEEISVIKQFPEDNSEDRNRNLSIQINSEGLQVNNDNEEEKFPIIDFDRESVPQSFKELSISSTEGSNAPNTQLIIEILPEIWILSRKEPKKAVELLETIIELDKLSQQQDKEKLEGILCEIYLYIALIYNNAYIKEKSRYWLDKAFEDSCKSFHSIDFSKNLDHMMGEISAKDYKEKERYLNKILNSPDGTQFAGRDSPLYTLVARGRLYLEHDDQWKELAKKDFDEALEKSYGINASLHLKIIIHFAFIDYYLKRNNQIETDKYLREVKGIIKEAYPEVKSHFHGIYKHCKAEALWLFHNLTEIEKIIDLYQEAIEICRETLPDGNDLVPEYEYRLKELPKKSDHSLLYVPGG